MDDRERYAARAGRPEREPRVAAEALERPHPGPRQYAVVAAVLAVITAFEVGVYYVHGLGLAMAPILLTLAASKFALVALFYMHLRFDNRLFSLLFAGGLAIAASILLALLALFSYHALV